MSAGERELLVARAYLSSVAEPPAVELERFIAEHGAIAAARLVASGDCPEGVADEVDARRTRVSGAAVLDAGEAIGVRLVVPEHPEWPAARFDDLTAAGAVGVPRMAAPVALWIRDSRPGRSATEWETRCGSVSIVGARAASGYGEHAASEFGYALAMAGFSVVSGAAYGIDGAAHRGALAAGKPTVAFLACGVDIDYPAGHGRLLDSIAEQGLVVSEYPPGTPPRKHRFLVRNRLIAAAGHGTVVVEAGARSGAANTVHTADALGRSVMAVPGPVTAASSVGCHQMVRAGKAVLVTKPAEVIELISPLGRTSAAEDAVPVRITDDLDPHARLVHDALAQRQGASAERVAHDCGLPLRKVRSVLPRLEMSGLVVLEEDGWARRT